MNKTATCFAALLALVATAAYAQPYPIGTRTITYQDPARNNRNIQTYLYYPATAAGANQPVAAGQFPVVVIGHGFTMTHAPYAYIGNDLAANGYITAIPNTETGFSPSHTAFALDMAFLVDKLYVENNNSGSPFYQHVQSDACIMGHSMGGGCAYLAAQNNPNVTATATFAAAETNPSAIAAAANVNCPSLVFSGSADCVTPPAQHQVPIYNALPTCKVYASLTGGGHCNFAAYNFNCSFGEFTCNPAGPPMPAGTQQAITLDLLRPWLDRFLKNIGAAGPQFTATFNNYVNNNQITGSIDCAILPVELVSFRVRRTRNNLTISWQTASERNADHFVLEKSTDGVRFLPLTKLSAQNDAAAYQHTDAEPFPADNYYRLKMVDRDGSYAYSPVVREHFEVGHLRVWPVPFGSVLHLETEPTDAVDQVELYDGLGRLVWRQQADGAPVLRLDLPTLPAGPYWLAVSGAGGTAVRAVFRE